MKKVVVMVVVLSSILTSCGATRANPIITSEATPPLLADTSVPTPTPISTPVMGPEGSHSAIDSAWEAKLIDQTWISPAEVKIGNLYPGATTDWNIRIHNGDSTRKTFIVEYGQPTSTKEGYSVAPPEVKDWVIIADNTPVIEARGTVEVLVVVAVPKDAVVKERNFEFWTMVREKSSALVQTQLATRWIVSMR